MKPSLNLPHLNPSQNDLHPFLLVSCSKNKGSVVIPHSCIVKFLIMLIHLQLMFHCYMMPRHMMMILLCLFLMMICRVKSRLPCQMTNLFLMKNLMSLKNYSRTMLQPQALSRKVQVIMSVSLLPRNVLHH